LSSVTRNSKQKNRIASTIFLNGVNHRNLKTRANMPCEFSLRTKKAKGLPSKSEKREFIWFSYIDTSFWTNYRL